MKPLPAGAHCTVRVKWCSQLCDRTNLASSFSSIAVVLAPLQVRTLFILPLLKCHSLSCRPSKLQWRLLPTITLHNDGQQLYVISSVSERVWFNLALTYSASLWLSSILYVNYFSCHLDAYSISVQPRCIPSRMIRLEQIWGRKLQSHRQTGSQGVFRISRLFRMWWGLKFRTLCSMMADLS